MVTPSDNPDLVTGSKREVTAEEIVARAEELRARSAAIIERNTLLFGEAARIRAEVDALLASRPAPAGDPRNPPGSPASAD